MAKRRRRRDERAGPSGFLVVDKPVGWTSHDVVDAARHWLGTRRVGHLGTLDPSATGVLPLAVREATKLVPFLAGGSKVYRGCIRLGVETETFDAEGEITRRFEGVLPEIEVVQAAMALFVGEVKQIPPMYSAVKHQGVPLYRLARRGVEVERATRTVRIERFELLGYTPPNLEIEVVCSPGTYVRVLAVDLGVRLGCGAHLAALRRTRNGPFRDEQVLAVDVLEAEAAQGAVDKRVIPPLDPLDFPRAHLNFQEVRNITYGGMVPGGRHAVGMLPGTFFAGVSPEGRLLAVLELRPDRQLAPLRVFPQIAASE